MMLNNEYIKRCKEIHNTIDYDKCIFIDNNSLVTLSCTICKHEWKTTPSNHLYQKTGCPKCAGNIKRTTKEFIEEAKIIHSDRYDYSEVEYINNETPVRIKCELHGVFLQKPVKHVNGKGGCARCSGRFNLTFEEWVIEFNKVHDFEYEYISYNKETRKLTIKCNKHGIFEQLRGNHIKGHKCEKCATNDRSHTRLNPEILKEYKRYKRVVHGYSNSEYSKYEKIVNPNNLTRGFEKYHMDHMYSVRDAFLNNVPIEIVGSFVNLQIIWGVDNRLKGRNSSITKEELYELYKNRDNFTGNQKDE